MNCLKCNNDNMVPVKLSVLRPEEDVFVCKKCESTQLRYAGTKYETESEKQIRLGEV